MTKNTLHILLALSDGPQHGYAIKQHVRRRTSGEVDLGAGTLYESMQRLEHAGWIREVGAPEDARRSGGPPRRFYGLTPAGRSALRAELRHLAAVVEFAAARKLVPRRS